MIRMLRPLVRRSSVAVVLAGMAAAVAFAQQEPAAERAASAPPLEFRRVFVPADRLNGLRRQGVEYRPIDREDFERLIELAGRETSAEGPLPAVRIEEARYSARLTDRDVLSGEMEVDVALDGAGPALLDVAPLALAIGDVAWKRDGAAAILGLAADGRTVALVEESDTLVCRWSLRGRREGGDLRFAFAGAASGAAALDLALPAKYVVEADDGPLVALRQADDQERVWRVELGGRGRAELRLRDGTVAAENGRTVLVRQSATYDVSRKGVEVAVRFDLDIEREPLQRLDVAVDPGLRIVSARLGEEPLAWSAPEAEEGEPQHVTLELPRRLVGGGHAIHLNALGAVPLDDAWWLPAVRPLDVFWREGESLLRFPPELTLERLAATGARQSQVQALPALAGEAIALQHFSPQARVQLVLAERPERLEADSATAVRLSAAGASGTIVADLRVAHGERFDLHARIAPSWTIDSVVTEPADALGDWGLVGDDYASGRLRIELARALTPQRPLRLEVRGRRLQSSLGESLTAEDLQMLAIEGATAGERLVAVESGGGFQLELRGADRLRRLDPRLLRAPQSTRFLDPPAGVVFEADAAAAGLRATLRESSPRFTAEIAATATAGPAMLSETYVIRCTPQGTPLERLRVRCSHARNAPLRWALVGDEPQPLAAQRLPPETGADTSHGEETWEVELRQPQTAPFAIVGTRSTSLVGTTPLSLAGLPDAQAQQGTVLVEAEGDAPFRVVNDRLKAVPPPVVPDDRPRTALGAFRYEPAHDSLYAESAAVSLAPLAPADDRGGAVIWECLVQSRVAPDQQVEHAIVLRVEHAGSAALALQLAPQCVDLRVSIDGAPAPWHATPRTVSVALPAGRRFSTVTLKCAAPAGRGNLGGEVAWPLRALQPPCLATAWTLWLPPGYDLLSHDAAWRRAEEPRPTWTERLFGPLARNPHAAAFDPLAVDDWRDLADFFEGGSDAWRGAESFLAALAEDTSGEAPATWGERLASAAAVEASGTAFWIDAPAMAEASLPPDAPFPAAVGGTPVERGAALLERGRLALLVGHEYLILTTVQVAALHRGDLQRTPANATFLCRRGDWSARLERMLEQGGGARFVAAERWPATASAQPAWSEPAVAGFDPSDTANWTAFRLTAERPTAGEVAFVRADLFPALGWAAFAGIVLTGWRKPTADARRRARRVAVALGATAVFSVVALAVPPAFVPVASGAVLGSLGCVLGSLRGGVRPPDASERRSLSSLRRGVPVAGLLLLAVAAAWPTGRAPAQDVVDESPPPRNVHEVLIPVSAPEEPSAAHYCLVPEALYQHLEERVALATGRPRAWLIDRAAYSVAPAWDIPQQGPAASELRAMFNLHVFERRQRVRIPLAGVGPGARPTTATLDGAEIRLDWEDEGGLMAFDVAEPGRYQLLVTLTLGAALDESGLASLRLTTPAVPRATVEAPAPPDAPLATVESALGAVASDSEGERLLAQLGPATELVVAWPAGSARPGQQPVLEVQQLLWLKVRPGAVSLDVRLNLSSRRGDVRTIRLAVDRGLQLLPPDGVQVRPAVPARGDNQGGRQLIDLEFAEPLAERATLDLTFLVADSSGLGNLRLPRFSVSGAATSERLLAVSLDEAALDCQESGNAELEAIALPDFAARWEGAVEMPKFAYRLPEGDVRWGLTCSPRPPTSTAEAELTISAGAGRAEVRFDVEARFSGARFQHRLALPAEVQVDSVTIAEGAERRSVRWAREDSGALTVFLAEAATTSGALRVVGWLPLPESGDVAVPRVRLEGADTQTTRVAVYRQPNVLVELGEADAFGAAESAAAEAPDTALGRLVRSYQAPADAPWGVLRVSPNPADAILDSAVSLARDARGNWSATLECLLEVRGGVVDELRFDVSPEWIGPFEVVPAATIEIVAVPAEERRQLLVRPREAIAASTRVTIRGQLSPPSGGGIRAPLVVPLSAAGNRYVLLPRRAGGAPLAWETQGLRGAELPPGFPPPADLDVWQVVADLPAAVLRRTESSSAAPRVRLADCRLARQPDGSVFGVASFDLDPAGLARCPLWLPGEATLVQVSVEGERVVPVAEAANRWRLDLSSARLPQLVVVAFTGSRERAPLREGVELLAAPRLGEIPVDRVQWTVADAGAADAAELLDARPVDRLRCELDRLAAIVAGFQAARALAGEESPDDVARWAARGLVRWEAALSAAEMRIALLGDVDAARVATAELREISARFDAHRDRLQPGGPSATPWMADPLARWEAAAREQDSALHATTDDDTLQLLLRRPDPERGDWASRMQATAIVLLAAVAAVFLLRRPSAWSAIERAAPAWIVAAGLFWWLWLAPSALGWAIVLAGCGAALWRVRRARTSEPASSIVEISVASR